MELSLMLVSRLVSADGSAKYLLKTQDDNFVECMYIPRKAGVATYCVSSQVGCAVGCLHCVSGKYGFVRNLTAQEIYDQVVLMRYAENAECFRTIVFYMGIGEPFLNRFAVIDSLKLLKSFLKVLPKNITISTCGVIPGIMMLSEFHFEVRLAISLHSVKNAVRDRLVPLNRQYNIEQIGIAIEHYNLNNKHPVLLQYTLIAGENDSNEDARLLADFSRLHRCEVRLIPLNSSPQIALQPSSETRMREFYTTIMQAGVLCKIRGMRGLDIAGGCGQMRYYHQKEQSIEKNGVLF